MQIVNNIQQYLIMKIRITACDIAVKQKNSDTIDLAKGKESIHYTFSSHQF